MHILFTQNLKHEKHDDEIAQTKFSYLHDACRRSWRRLDWLEGGS